MKFYCHECKIPFCPTCIVKHNKHEICEIEEIAGSFKKQFIRYLDNVSERMANINERSENVSAQIESFAKIAGKVKTSIIGRGEYLKQMIDTHTGKLLSELNLHKSQVVKEMENRKGELRMNLMVCDNPKQLCSKVISGSESFEVVCMAEELKTRAEEIQVMPIPDTGTLPRIKFIPSNFNITKNHPNIVGKLTGKIIVAVIFSELFCDYSIITIY